MLFCLSFRIQQANFTSNAGAQAGGPKVSAVAPPMQLGTCRIMQQHRSRIRSSVTLLGLPHHHSASASFCAQQPPQGSLACSSVLRAAHAGALDLEDQAAALITDSVFINNTGGR